MHDDFKTAFTAVGKGTVTQAFNPAGTNANTYNVATAKTINFAASASDIATFAIILPTGVNLYRVASMRVYGAAGNMNTPTISLFTAAGGTGTSVIASTAITITTSIPNNANSAQVIVPGGANTVQFNATQLFLHITSSTATSTTANVALQIDPYY